MGAREATPRPDDISLLELYRRMVLVRVWEETQRDLWLQRRLTGDLFLSLGQEATSVGLASALNPDDGLFVSRRGLALRVARGLALDEALAIGEGSSGDEPSVGHATPAGHLAPAVGAALAMRLEGEGRVCMVEFGDGAVGDGLFHESLNLAALWRAPVVFACVNNQYAGDQPFGSLHPVPSVVARADAYGIPAERVDGQDAQATLTAAIRAVEHARASEGPALIECLTYRIAEHQLRRSPSEPATRPREEVDFWRNRDPLRRFRAVLLRRQLAHAESLEVIETAARIEVEQAVRRFYGPLRPAADATLALVPLNGTPGTVT